MQILEVVAHLFHPRRSNNHRPRALHPESLLSYAFLLIGFSCFVFNIGRVPGSMGSVLGYSSEINSAQVISLTNAQRAQLQLSPVVSNPQLTAAAQAKAKDMFAEQYWAHVSPTGKQPWDFIAEAHYDYSAAGENLARDFLHGDEMMTAWMNSPTHKANIVNPKYTEIGVGVMNGTLQGVETTLVVQLFGKPAASGTQPAVTSQAAETQKAVVAEPEKISNPTLPEVRGTTAPENTTLPELAVDAETANVQNANPDSTLSPLQVFKAVALGVIMLLIGVLTYDMYVIERRSTVRLVGNNTAHIFYFVAIAAIIIFFKAGVIQ